MLITAEQRKEKIFLTIQDYIKEKGYSPSIRELCVLCDISSTSTVFSYLQKLKDEKRIDYVPQIARSIRIIS